MESKSEKSARGRAQIIETVRTPLGFFVLVVLVVEVILGGIVRFEPDDNVRTYLVMGMLLIIIALIAIVSFFTYAKPEALTGMTPMDSETHQLLISARKYAALQDKLLGEWQFEGRYQVEGHSGEVRLRGTATISKGEFAPTADGEVSFGEKEDLLRFTSKVITLTPTELTIVGEVPYRVGVNSTGINYLRLVYGDNGDSIVAMRGEFAIIEEQVFGRSEWRRRD